MTGTDLNRRQLLTAALALTGAALCPAAVSAATEVFIIPGYGSCATPGLYSDDINLLERELAAACFAFNTGRRFSSATTPALARRRPRPTLPDP